MRATAPQVRPAVAVTSMRASPSRVIPPRRRAYLDVRDRRERDDPTAWRLDPHGPERLEIPRDFRSSTDDDVEHFLLVVELADLGALHERGRSVAHVGRRKTCKLRALGAEAHLDLRDGTRAGPSGRTTERQRCVPTRGLRPSNRDQGRRCDDDGPADPRSILLPLAGR